MKKKILIFSVLIAISQTIFAQKNNSLYEKKFKLSLGATYNALNSNFGGNVKFDYFKNKKLGIGLKIIATSFKFYDYNTHSYNVTYNNGYLLISDLTMNYYLIGNNADSKGGIYADLGVGYNIIKSNSTIQFSAFQSTNGYEMHSGFGGHLSLGGSYKFGPGRIYLEAMAGSIITGSSKRYVPFPEGHPYLNDGGNYKKSRGFYYDLISFNLGYSFYF